mmetsp:Transcript_5068/g.14954  ORF Transcript_5068/g.14954 Transcript_5068/m.14954 type:complete len:262 (-) Transcript_5068:884-1669(-)
MGHHACTDDGPEESEGEQHCKQRVLGDARGKLLRDVLAHVDRLEICHDRLHLSRNHHLVKQFVDLHHVGQRHRVRKQVRNRLRVCKPQGSGQQQTECDADLHNPYEDGPPNAERCDAHDAEAISGLNYRKSLRGVLQAQMPGSHQVVNSSTQDLGNAQRPHEDNDAGKERAGLEALKHARAQEVTSRLESLQLQGVGGDGVVLLANLCGNCLRYVLPPLVEALDEIVVERVEGQLCCHDCAQRHLHRYIQKQARGQQDVGP